MSNNYKKCDVCGGFHLESETELVTIEITKGKDCDISNFFSKKETAAPAGKVFVNTERPVVEENKNTLNIPKPAKVGDRVEVFDTPPVRPMAQRKSIIPRGLSSMMIPPGDGRFEAQGAKEVRQA